MAAPKQSRSLIVVSDKTSNKTSDSHYKNEIFIGNLRYDLSSRALITYIQELFKSVNVHVPSFRFTIFQRKTKKQPPYKYAFVTLANEAEEERTYQLDDTENLDFVIDGRKLSIKRRTSSRHKQNKNIKMTFNGKVDKLKRSKSVPGLHTKYNCGSITEILKENALKKEYYLGQNLSSEDRFTEYKRGAGNYIRSVLISHIRRYICAFLNSKGGRLMIGVDDNCKVYGISCNRKEEDQARCQIDNTLKKFKPLVSPHLYVVDFIPVRMSPCDHIEYETTTDPLLKVLEVSVNWPTVRTLYENDKEEVFIRRDGSVEGPLKPSQIVEWCRINFTSNNESNQVKEAGTENDHIVLAKESFTSFRNLENLEDVLKLQLLDISAQLKRIKERGRYREKRILRELRYLQANVEELKQKQDCEKPYYFCNII